MIRLKKASVTVPPFQEDDQRIGHLLGREASRQVAVVVAGFPVDEGVVRNHGRPGAAEAPDRIRAFLGRLTPDARQAASFSRLLRHTLDLGNLVGEGSLEEYQEKLGEVLAPHLSAGRVVILLGGGHESSYGHFLGYVQAGLSVSVLNWDAHPDVRPLKEGRGHSGSPFRQILEHPSGGCRSYLVAGLQPSGVAASHLDFLRNRGGRFLWRSELSRERVAALYESLSFPSLVSFDFDAVDAAHAPGVSAPSLDGLDLSIWLECAYWAGRSPHVQSIDLVEVNPSLDQDDRTSRLAALTLWHFYRGLSERETAP